MLLQLDGHRLYYDDLGDEARPVVCFVHSLVADIGMWAEQVEPVLHAGFRVVRVDLRGHGGSDEVAGPYSMAMLAEDVEAVMTRLRIAQADVVGSSLGGMVGQALAIAFPHRVRSLLLSGSLSRSPGLTPMWQERLRLVHEAHSTEPLAEPIMARWFLDSFRQERPSRWQELRDTLATTSALGFLGCSAAILDFDFTPRLASLQAPLLVICGSKDVSTPEVENRLTASLVPNGRYEAIEDARHLPNIERPEAFNRHLLDWLGAHRAAC